jgi:hypothetical protein
MKTKFGVVLCASLVFTACTGEETPVQPGDGRDQAHQGAGHQHPRAQRTALGEVKVGAYTFSVFQVTEIEAGKEGDFDLDFAPGQELPAIVRAWIGAESGQGAMKVRFEKESATRLHGHPEVPDPIPAGGKLWIEVETPAGTHKGSVALRP